MDSIILLKNRCSSLEFDLLNADMKISRLIKENKILKDEATRSKRQEIRARLQGKPGSSKIN